MGGLSETADVGIRLKVYSGLCACENIWPSAVLRGTPCHAAVQSGKGHCAGGEDPFLALVTHQILHL